MTAQEFKEAAEAAGFTPDGKYEGVFSLYAKHDTPIDIYLTEDLMTISWDGEYSVIRPATVERINALAEAFKL